MFENYLKLNHEFSKIEKKPLILLSIIFIFGLMIRLYYVPYDLPIILDGFNGYTLYALDISILGHLPNYFINQSGWPEFLSIFFMNFHSDNLMEYMNLQRTISVVLSSLTIIPVYYICKKFFNPTFSLIGSIIFTFQPFLIINSTLGVSEPLYIFVISVGILFFLNSNKIFIFSSFGLIAWATIIRPEGQFWFYAFSIIYFLRFRKSRKELLMYLLCLGIFLIVLSPIVVHRIQCCENDGIIGRVLGELNNYESFSSEIDNPSKIISYGPDYYNGVKLFVWSLIPVFIIFVPIGLFEILRNKRFQELILIFIPMVILTIIIYSISIAPDTRYVYTLFPIFSVISIFGIKYITRGLTKKKYIFLIIGVIILSSILFLEYKKIDYSDEYEVYEISKIIIKDNEGINKGSKISQFVKNIEIQNKWPIIEYTGRLSESYQIKRFTTSGFTNLEDFLEHEKERGLTHLIIDKNSVLPKFLRDVYDDEKNYPYLIKEYDSEEYDYNYLVKKFKINYDIFQKHN